MKIFYSTLVTFAFVVASLAFGPASTLAQSALPKGKPFVEIEGQIVEVKNDVSELEVAYKEIKEEVEGQETDFQKQIDQLQSIVISLKAKDASLQSEIDALAAQVTENGYDLASALSEIVRLEGEIEMLEASAGDQSDAIAALQAELDAVRTDVAANAEGLLGAIADIKLNGELIAMLETDVAELESELAAKQDDIGTTCPEGTYVYGVQDDGTLQCAVDDATATLQRITTVKFADVSNWSFLRCAIDILGVCVWWESVLVKGNQIVFAVCPEGFTVAAGGFNVGFDDVFAESSWPRSASCDPYTGAACDAWQYYFDNRSGDTGNRYVSVYANCLRTN